jgi:hypothetical protein
MFPLLYNIVVDRYSVLMDGYILNLTFLFCFIILLAEIDSDLYLQQPFISNISVTYDRSEVISMVL